MISVAAIGNTSEVCDHRLMSYALEQAERLISHARLTHCIDNGNNEFTSLILVNVNNDFVKLIL